MLPDDDEGDAAIGSVRNRGQPLPATPARRLCVLCADDLADRGVQAVRADHQISRRTTAVGEIEANPGVAVGDADHLRVTPNPFGRKTFQQSLEQNPARDHPDRRTHPVHDRRHVEGGHRASRRRHHPHRGQLLAGAVHGDAELPQHGFAVRPDGDGAAAGPHLGALLEHRDVMAVPQQSPGDGDATHPGADNQDPQRPFRRWLDVVPALGPF